MHGDPIRLWAKVPICQILPKIRHGLATSLFETRCELPKNATYWKRPDAESHNHDVLERAKTETVQYVIEHDGVFDVTFTLLKKKPKIGELLARGGPGRD